MACSDNRPSQTYMRAPIQQQQPMMQQPMVQQQPMMMQQGAQAIPTQQMISPPTGTGFVQTGQWGQTTQIDPAAIPSSPALINTMPPPIIPAPSNMPETLTEYIFTPGFLRAHIGELMRVEFLLTNNITDRVGYLREVGASYIVLDSLNSDSKIMCDIYSIRFVTIIENPTQRDLMAAF